MIIRDGTVNDVLVLTTADPSIDLVAFGAALDAATGDPSDFGLIRDMFDNIEVTFVGSSRDDDFSEENSLVDNELNGNGGADRLTGGNENDTILGGEGDDTLIGGPGNDILRGEDGRDRLQGDDGDDILDASGGAAGTQSYGDIVSPGTGSNTIIGNQDHYDNDAGIDLVYGDVTGSGGLTFTVNADGSGTVVSGTAGIVNDTFTFTDFFMGSEDADTFLASAAEVTIVGGPGDDIITGGAGRTKLSYYLEDGPFGILADFGMGQIFDSFGDIDTVSGSIDKIQGTELVDIFIDSETGGMDINGRGGDDLISGGTGDNYLTGGSGADWFFYTGGHDIITDFSLGEDRLNFTDTGLSVTELLTAFGGVSENGDGNAVLDFGAATGTLELQGIDAATVQAFAADPSNYAGALSRQEFLEEAAPDDMSIGALAPATLLDASLTPVDDGLGTITIANPSSAFFGGSAVEARLLYVTLDLGAGPVRLLTGGEYRIDGTLVFHSVELQVPLDGPDGFLQGLVNAQGGNNTVLDDLMLGQSTRFVGNSKDGEHSLSSNTEGSLLFGGGGSDELRGSQGDDLLAGNDGNDELDGREGNDILVGYEGSNFLQGGEGTDTYFGDVNDKVSFESESMAVDVDLAAGTAQIGAITEGIFGIGRVRGTEFDDTLRGTEDNNQLEGLDGADTLDGREGYDTARYVRELSKGGMSGITVDLGAGTATDAFGDQDTLISIEEVQGTNANDTLTAGDDFATLRGEAGNDILILGSGGGIVDGGRGYDRIEYKGGHATVRDLQIGIDDLLVDPDDLDGVSESDVQTAITNATESGGNVTISFSAEHSLTLDGVSKAELLQLVSQTDAPQQTVTGTHTGLATFAIDLALAFLFLDPAATLVSDGNGVTATDAANDIQVRVDIADFRLNSNGSWEGTIETLTFSEVGGGVLAVYSGGEIAAFNMWKAIHDDQIAIANGQVPTNLPALYDTLSLDLTGSAGSDFLSGANQSDVLRGLGGSDIIFTYAGDDVVVPGEGLDNVVLGIYEIDGVTGDVIIDVSQADGSNRIEVASDAATTDVALILGFDASGGAAVEDFIVITDPGGAPASVGVTKVTIDSANLADSFDANGNPDPGVLTTIGTEALTEGGAGLFDGDAFELLLMEDGNDAAVVRISGTAVDEFQVLAFIDGVTDLNGLEDNILFSTPTV